MAKWHRAYVVGVLMVAVACGGGEPPQTPAGQSPGPALALERFLRAANVNDLEVMTQLFGTTDRTIVAMEGETMAERRMMVLASLLRHDDWSIQGQRAVPGRIDDATELLVSLSQGDRTVDVPFLVVRTDDGGWIIERISVEPLTAPRQG